jgi:ferric-dicitrate binding protein FerR (iron transport regulator)
MTDLRDIEQVLKDSLNVAPASERRLDELRASVDREWRNSIAKPRTNPMRRRTARVGLAAAAAAAAAMIALWVGRTAAPPESLGSVSRYDAGGVAVRSGLLEQRKLKNGDALRVGDRLTTRGAALVTLAHGGTLRLGPDSSLTVDSISQLSLHQGLVYVEIPPDAVQHLRVVTIAGSVEHLGTEFEVFCADQAVRVRVREGRVRFLGNSDTVIANAGTELLVAPGKAITRRSIDTFGGEWLWTAELAPEYDIEGKTLIGFLNWVSRELGRPFDFADANARQIADRTILHGSVRGQTPLRAMSNVLLTASLSYEIRGDTIWVRTNP